MKFFSGRTIFFRGRPMLKGNDQCFMEDFRGECNFYSVFRGLRGEKKRHVLTTGGGGDTDIIGNSPVYPEAF